MARVLVADDAAVARRILKNILTLGGHDVVGEASDGALAVESYRELRPDLILMDMTMPQVDGLEASRRIMAEFPDARIVMVTSITSEATVRQSADLGVAAYLVKPFSSERVLELAARILAQHPSAGG